MMKGLWIIVVYFWHPHRDQLNKRLRTIKQNFGVSLLHGQLFGFLSSSSSPFWNPAISFFSHSLSECQLRDRDQGLIVFSIFLSLSLFRYLKRWIDSPISFPIFFLDKIRIPQLIDSQLSQVFSC